MAKKKASQKSAPKAKPMANMGPMCPKCKSGKLYTQMNPIGVKEKRCTNCNYHEMESR